MILGQGHYAGTAAVKDLRHLFTQGQELRKEEKKRGKRQQAVAGVSWNRWEIFYSSGYSSSRLDGERPLGRAHGEQVVVSCTTLLNFLYNYH